MKSGSLNFLEPFGHLGPVMGLIYLPSLGYVIRDSSVGIATRYWVDDLGIESRWWLDFPHPSRPALGPAQPPIQWVPGIYRGVKQPGLGVDHRHPSSAEVKEKSRAVPVLPIWVFLTCYRVNFTFHPSVIYIIRR